MKLLSALFFAAVLAIAYIQNAQAVTLSNAKYTLSYFPIPQANNACCNDNLNLAADVTGDTAGTLTITFTTPNPQCTSPNIAFSPGASTVVVNIASNTMTFTGGPCSSNSQCPTISGSQVCSANGQCSLGSTPLARYNVTSTASMLAFSRFAADAENVAEFSAACGVNGTPTVISNTFALVKVTSGAASTTMAFGAVAAVIVSVVAMLF